MPEKWNKSIVDSITDTVLKYKKQRALNCTLLI
jgi:hypothetical protein